MFPTQDSLSRFQRLPRNQQFIEEEIEEINFELGLITEK